MKNAFMRIIFWLGLIVVAGAFLVLAFWAFLAILAVYVGLRIYLAFSHRKVAMQYHAPNKRSDHLIVDAEIIDDSEKPRND